MQLKTNSKSENTKMDASTSPKEILTRLPVELKLYIFENCGLMRSSIIALALTCKAWHDVFVAHKTSITEAEDDVVWGMAEQATFPGRKDRFIGIGLVNCMTVGLYRKFRDDEIEAARQWLHQN